MIEISSKQYKEDLLRSIPVVAAMDISIDEINEDFLTLRAPLTKNINYEGTAFGGSLNTLAVLSCYLMVHHSMKMENVVFDSLVIQDSNIKYLKPVHGDFCARAEFQNKEQFLKLMKRKGTGRAQMQANLYLKSDSNEKVLVTFSGRFVAS